VVLNSKELCQSSRGAKYSFSKAFCCVNTYVQEAIEKPFVALIQFKNNCSALQQEGFGKSMKILKHIVRAKMKTLLIKYEIKKRKTNISTF
jgi:hypothetical protein